MIDLFRVADLGCIICRRPAEIHHLRAGMGMGQRSADVIPLCPEHHRTGGHGVAFHAGRKTWETQFGTETELLQETQKLLEQVKELARQDVKLPPGFRSCCVTGRLLALPSGAPRS